MGLIKEGERVAILTDILGTEDHSATWTQGGGTRKGVTSIQMDIKIEGLDFKIIVGSASTRRARRGYTSSTSWRRRCRSRARSSPSTRRGSHDSDPARTASATSSGPKARPSARFRADRRSDQRRRLGLITVSGVGEAGERARDIIASMVQVPEVGNHLRGQR